MHKRRGIPFEKGDPRAVEAGRKGGSRPKKATRSPAGLFTGTLFDVMDWAGMTGPTWEPWRSLLRTSLGLPHSGQDLVFFRDHTDRSTPPAAPVSEAWIVAGRRGGKSRMAAAVGLTKALQFDPSRLALGELGLVPIISADRKQSRAVFSYLKALCQLPQVRPYVHRVLRDVIELHSGVNIEVSTASYRTIRGYTVITAVLDEVAFWRDEGSSTNPDSEILDALRPGMTTVADALLFAISSPYARKGELFNTHDRYYGQDDPHVIVWVADTRSLNPTVAAHIITRAFEEDPIAAASEYGQDGKVTFRHDVEAFLDPDAVTAVTMPERRELPPMPGVKYVAFVDPSGGSQDSFTLAIAHREGDRAVLDVLRERRPPFDPDAVTKEYAGLLLSYGVTTVTGDRYAGEWPRERFRSHGIRYEASERVKSQIYRELVAPVNAKRVELLDLPALRAQLVGLERRVARGGNDSIDHAPGGRDDLANAAAGALVLALPAIAAGQYEAHFSFGRGNNSRAPKQSAPVLTARQEREQKAEVGIRALIAHVNRGLDRRAQRDFERKNKGNYDGPMLGEILNGGGDT